MRAQSYRVQGKKVNCVEYHERCQQERRCAKDRALARRRAGSVGCGGCH